MSITALSAALAAINWIATATAASSFGTVLASLTARMAAQTAINTAAGVSFAGLRAVITTLWGVIAAHPIGALILAVSGLVVAWNLWQDAAIKEGKAAEKSAAERQNSIQTLETLKKRLQESTEGSLEHYSVIERLIKEYPELGTALNNSKGSIENQIQAVSELIDKYKEWKSYDLKKVMYGNAASIEKMTEDIKKLQDRISNFDDVGGDSLDPNSQILDPETIDKMNNQLAKTKAELEAVQHQQALVLVEYENYMKKVQGSEFSLDSKQFGVPDEVFQSAKDYLAIQEKIRKAVQDVASASLNASQEYIDFVSEATGGLNDLESATAKEYGQKLQKQIAELNNARSQQNMTDKEYYAARGKLMVDDALKFEKKEEDIKMNAAQSAAYQLELINRLYNAADDSLGKRIQVIQKEYDKEVQAAKGNSEKIESAAKNKDAKLLAAQQAYQGQSKALEEAKKDQTLKLEEALTSELIKVYQDRVKQETDLVKSQYAQQQETLSTSLQIQLSQIDTQGQSEKNLMSSRALLYKDIWAQREGISEDTLNRITSMVASSGQSEEALEKKRLQAKRQYYDDVTNLAQKQASELISVVNKEAEQEKQAVVAEYEAKKKIMQDGITDYSSVNLQILTLEQQKSDKIKEINTKTSESLKTIYNDLLTAYKTQLANQISLYEAQASKIKSINEKLKQSESDLYSGLRDIRQSGMNDYQKYQDDQLEYKRKITEAQKKVEEGSYSDAEELYKDAASLAKSMAKEVKGENDTVLVSLSTAVQDATAKYKESMKGYQDALKAERDAANTEMEASKVKIDELAAKIKELETYYQNLSKTQIKADTSEALAKVKELKEAIDSIKDKTVTITYVKVGESSSSSSSSSDSSSTPTGYAEGGVVGGTGNKDNVIIAATPKEFIEPVTSIDHYGNMGLRFLEAFRKKMLPKDFFTSLAGSIQKFKLGGQVLSESVRNTIIPHMATGGLVAESGSYSSSSSESLVVRFQVGNEEYPVSVQDPVSKDMIKTFSSKISKMRLTRVC